MNAPHGFGGTRERERDKEMRIETETLRDPTDASIKVSRSLKLIEFYYIYKIELHPKQQKYSEKPASNKRKIEMNGEKYRNAFSACIAVVVSLGQLHNR